MALLYPWLYDCSTAPTFEFRKYLFNLEYGGYNKEKKTTGSQTKITIIWLSALSRTEHTWDIKLSSRGHVKESACDAGDQGLVPGLERSPGEGNSISLQHSSLENSMDRGAWQATVHRVTKSQTPLSD